MDKQKNRTAVLAGVRSSSEENRKRVDKLAHKAVIDGYEEMGVRGLLKNDAQRDFFIDKSIEILPDMLAGAIPEDLIQTVHDYIYGINEFSDYNPPNSTKYSR